jgi:ferredoxin
VRSAPVGETGEDWVAMRVALDRDKCTGLGICESVAPDHFEIDDRGDLVLLREDIGPDEVSTLEDAVRSCPTGALQLSGHA